MTMWSRLHITVFVTFAALVWWLVLIFQGTPVSRDHFTPFGTVVAFLVIFGIAFERFLWRQPWLHRWFVNRPDLRGTWHVSLQSDWVDPNTNQQTPTIECFMGVEQTFSTLQMHLMTPESESWFIADRIRSSPKGNGYQVVGVYTNQPNTQLRGSRSEMHIGSLVLDTHGRSQARPDTLTGEYWTDRKTKGTMTFSNRMSTVYTRFADARSAFDNSKSPQSSRLATPHEAESA